LEIARRLAIETPRIRVYRNRHRFASSKKAALKTAVEQARGTYLLFSDADCTPPPTWAQGMIRSFQGDTGVVAGFAPQSIEQPSCWSRFLFTDSLASALVAAASIGWGRGITCTGRNLGLRARALEAIGGYDALPDSVSGDDDFVLQAISRHPEWRPVYCFGRETHVHASGPAGWAPFVRQKRRHISAGRFFRPGQKLGYALYHFCNAALWLSPLLFAAALPLISKLLLDYTVLRLFVRKLNIKLTLYDFVQWEILFPVVHLLSSSALFAARIRWA
jgi:cellulose synthase/poly-beta-1,6-N-acetylglucosamine synthase-like glycosyltransferase